MHALTKEILTQIPALQTAAQQNLQPYDRLSSAIPSLDLFLEGGLKYGSLSEWGLPLGQGGRLLLLGFLKTLTQELAQWALWINGHSQLEIYPPAWAARGVNLDRLRFASTTQPLKDMRPAFLDPFFRVIILDAPSKITPQDCAFLAQRARANRQIIILTRPTPLSPKAGNIWAQIRVNAWQSLTQHVYVQAVRGLSPRQIRLQPDEVEACL